MSFINCDDKQYLISSVKTTLYQSSGCQRRTVTAHPKRTRRFSAVNEYKSLFHEPRVAWSLSTGGIAPNQVIARSEFEVHRQMFTEWM